MGRQSKKQINAQLRNEIAQEYKNRIYRAEQECVVARAKFFTEQRLRVQAEEKVALLQEKIDQQEDWIRRLLEFADMDTDTRQKTIAEYRVNEQFSGFEHIINILETMLYKL